MRLEEGRGSCDDDDGVLIRGGGGGDGHDDHMLFSLVVVVVSFVCVPYFISNWISVEFALCQSCIPPSTLRRLPLSGRESLKMLTCLF